MMTCRLLYALLVLALCCCPYVCAAGSGDKTGEPGETPTPQDSVSSKRFRQYTSKKTRNLMDRVQIRRPIRSERPSKKVSTPATSSPTGTGEVPSRVPTFSRWKRCVCSSQGHYKKIYYFTRINR
ncbi:mucin TcMUC [Trypanosoma cruzi cruzi]|nr:mucin TcMUC [Trypanosoma cruzi cruzi]